jgi:hypothetical protein
MNLKHGQRGITLSGLIYSCIILGIVALIGMKLFPLYNEKMKVDMALDKVAADSAIGRMNKIEIVREIMKNFEVSDVDRWTTQEFTRLIDIQPKKGEDKRSVTLEYEIRGPLCCQLDIVLNYAKSFDIAGAGSSGSNSD